MCCVIVGIGNITTSYHPIIVSDGVGVGRSFNLSCTAPDAAPAAHVTWIFNNITIATGGQYNVSSARLTDSGVYLCRAENIAGYKESLVTVTILGMLLFTVY